MRTNLLVLVLAIWPVTALAQGAGCGRVDLFPGADWAVPAPEEAGWDIEGLAKAEALFRAEPSAALVAIHRGRPVVWWGDTDTRFTAQSLRKALLNALLGGLIAEGRLKRETTLEALGIDDSDPPLSPAERMATVEDLMRARSGIFHSALYETGFHQQNRAALAAEETAAGTDLIPPGARWVYNNWDFNALGTIVEQAGGAPIGVQFAERVAQPIGMQDFAARDVGYTTRDHPAEVHFGNRSDHRAYVFDMSTRDLARFGLLYLACGAWDGQPVLPAAWVRDSFDGPDTREGAPAGSDTGFGAYGYLWAIDRPGARYFEGLRLRDPFAFVQGNRGHVLAVFPTLDLVIAHQVATIGGVGPEAQLRRLREGSPEVSDDHIARLFAAIIAAHPDAATAFE
ncbi:MAG: serine hydrolase [Paracoccaceae bacterium]